MNTKTFRFLLAVAVLTNGIVVMSHCLSLFLSESNFRWLHIGLAIMAAVVAVAALWMRGQLVQSSEVEPGEPRQSKAELDWANVKELFPVNTGFQYLGRRMIVTQHIEPQGNLCPARLVTEYADDKGRLHEWFWLPQMFTILFVIARSENSVPAKFYTYGAA